MKVQKFWVSDKTMTDWTTAFLKFVYLLLLLFYHCSVEELDIWVCSFGLFSAPLQTSGIQDGCSSRGRGGSVSVSRLWGFLPCPQGDSWDSRLAVGNAPAHVGWAMVAGGAFVGRGVRGCVAGGSAAAGELVGSGSEGVPTKAESVDWMRPAWHRRVGQR